MKKRNNYLNIDKIRLGFIGLGQRGQGLLSTILGSFDDVEITALCDSYEDRQQEANDAVMKKRNKTAKTYSDYNKLLQDPNVNTVIISASWEAHIPLAIECMKAGKITAMEVGGAYSIDSCWDLVKTYEQTKTPFMFLENCCYGKNELFVTSLARKGIIGEVVYAHGSYFHDLREEICGGVKNRHYRLRNYLSRNCDNYPTHSLGPIAKILNINTGNRLISLVSRASKSRGLEEYVKGKEEYEFLQNKKFMQGDVVHTLIDCADGSLISLKLDTSLPHVYSREFTISGTKGMYSENGNILNIDGDINHDNYMTDCVNSAEKYYKYLPSIWKNITEEQLKAGHGGMDTLMLESFFNSIINNLEMPINVYDAATWMSVSCLSEYSIANGGVSVEIPDFTSGRWIMEKSTDVTDLD